VPKPSCSCCLAVSHEANLILLTVSLLGPLPAILKVQSQFTQRAQ
jgi:hypothetical protein